jgi:hypothetical protein
MRETAFSPGSDILDEAFLGPYGKFLPLKAALLLNSEPNSKLPSSGTVRETRAFVQNDNPWFINSTCHANRFRRTFCFVRHSIVRTFHNQKEKAKKSLDGLVSASSIMNEPSFFVKIDRCLCFHIRDCPTLSSVLEPEGRTCGCRYFIVNSCRF